jgi:uncharacterized protein DUF3352
VNDDTTPEEGPATPSYPTWETPSAATPADATLAVGESPADPASSPMPEPPGGVAVAVLDTIEPVDGDAPEGPPRGRFRAGRWIVAGLAGLFIVAGAGIGIKLFALRGTSDVLQRMVPADADVYATAYLDPSLSQKLHLRTLAGKFPALKGPQGIDRRIGELLGQAFKGSGLDFAKDVKPWLGTQLGVVVHVDDAGPHAALLVSSKNDPAAQAALAKLREASPGLWSDSQHDGVAVATSHGTGAEMAYAYLDHTAILSDQAGVIESIIDADRGGKPAIESSADYTRALEGLPTDRLAFVYVNSGGLLERYLTQFDQGSGLDINALTGPFSGLDAYRSVGAAVSAEGAGVAIHLSADVDATKLTAEQRAALGGSPHRNAVIDWTPDDALGLVAFTRFGETLQGFVDVFGASDPQMEQTLQDLGLTGADGLIAHMSGDAGLTATAATQGSIPNVAFMVGTDDAAASGRFLTNLRDLVTQTAGAFTGAGPNWQVESFDAAPYGSVEISYLSEPDLQGLGLEPAFATVKDMTIIGSSRTAVKAALTARGGGGNIGAAPAFKEAMGGSEADADLLEYFDVQGIAQAIVGSLSPEEQSMYSREVEPNLRAVKALAATQANGLDRSTVRVFVLIR